MSAQILGLTELTKALADLRSDNVKSSIADGVRAAADQMREVIQSEAPTGPTGNLKRSVQSGMFKKRTGKPIAGFVRANRKIAPHAHLVEFGARGGKMPANAFFSRGYLKAKARAEGAVEKATTAAIDKVW